MDEPSFPLKVTTGKYEVISSGVVHTTETEVKFELANLTYTFRLKDDSGEKRYDGEDVGENSLVINLYNFNSSMGEGKIEPVEIGNLGGRRLFVTWFVTSLQNNLRQFNYTFMLAE